MSDKRVDRFIESCVRCSFFSYEDIGEQEGHWCNRGERKLLDNFPEIPPSCPLPKLPSVTAKFLFDLGFEIRRNFNFKYEAGNDSEIAKRLTVAFKSIGVEI